MRWQINWKKLKVILHFETNSASTQRDFSRRSSILTKLIPRTPHMSWSWPDCVVHLESACLQHVLSFSSIVWTLPFGIVVLCLQGIASSCGDRVYCTLSRAAFLPSSD